MEKALSEKWTIRKKKLGKLDAQWVMRKKKKVLYNLVHFEGGILQRSLLL